MKFERLINRLIEWLKAHNIAAEQIDDCIDYIKKEKKLPVQAH